MITPVLQDGRKQYLLMYFKLNSSVHLSTLEFSGLLSPLPLYSLYSLTCTLVLFSLKKQREAWTLKAELCLVSKRNAGQGSWMRRDLNDYLCLSGDLGPFTSPVLFHASGCQPLLLLSELGFSVTPLRTTPTRRIMVFLKSIYISPVSPLGGKVQDKISR